MVNLLLGPCELCDAPAMTRCDHDCPGDARPRKGDPDDIAEDLRLYPRPMRPYSNALRLLRAAPR